MTERVRVRAVRGRVIDPFRGALGDDPERFAPREVDTQPFDEILATIERLPNVKVTRAGRRITFGRDHDVAKVAFASAGRFVSLDDATFEGDGALVLALLHALLPLFGAVELRIGTYVELVDGHEPLDPILKRYESWWVDESLKLAAKLEPPPAPAASPAPPPNAPVVKEQRLGGPTLYAAALMTMVLLVAITAMWRC